MLATRVIPCLDVAHGRVVKGVKFQGLTDQGDPVELAARYAEQGADERLSHWLAGCAWRKVSMRSSARRMFSSELA